MKLVRIRMWVNGRLVLVPMWMNPYGAEPKGEQQ